MKRVLSIDNQKFCLSTLFLSRTCRLYLDPTVVIRKPEIWKVSRAFGKFIAFLLIAVFDSDPVVEHRPARFETASEDDSVPIGFDWRQRHSHPAIEAGGQIADARLAGAVVPTWPGRLC